MVASSIGLPELTVRLLPETETLPPGVRLPRPGRDMTLAAARRTSRFSRGSMTMLAEGSQSE
ncbi:hypothetical protein D3C80_1190450 [compost metagenome]